ncbi:hypothetical protein [Rudaea sp.]|uniref:hypothetical protein n=1 Tax=Rudaea sp. TaxID=2136325 RepID=UPI003783E2B3
MAISWDLDVEESISFSDLIKYFDGLGADVLLKDLDESAYMLRRIYNNRIFLVEILRSQLDDLPAFERMNGYTSQVFILHRSAHYFVRAAIWLPSENARTATSPRFE